MIMLSNEDVVEALDEAIGKKANATDLTAHTSDTVIHHEHSNKDVLDATTASYTTEEKEKLSGVKEGAEATAQTVTGNNPTATNSTDGKIIYMKNSGYTEQTRYSGKNLLEMNTTNFALTDNGIKNLSQGGAMGTVDLKAGVTYSLSLLLLSKPSADTSFVSKINNVDIGDLSFVTIDTYNLNEKFVRTYTATEDCTVSIGMYGNANVETIEFQLQLEEGSTATDYEPYCGGTASPNPDYPQHIGGLADKGYFDGELLQGYYADELTIDTTSTSAVCSKNPIPCKEGDKIKVVHEVSDSSADDKFDVVFLDSDKNYLSVQTSFTNLSDDVATAPTNAKYFLFSIRRSGYELSPSTAEHIYVTINGMYAVRVKSVNKNLCPTYEKTLIPTSANCTKKMRVIGGRSIVISLTKERISDVTINNNYLYIYSYLYQYDKNGNLISKTLPNAVKLTSGSMRMSASVTLEKDTHSIIIDCSNNNSDLNVNTKVYDVQVEYGTVATPFEEHQETEALIPVSSPFYEGDYIEEYADGSGKIVRENGIYTATSANGWYTENTGIVVRLRNDTILAGKAKGSSEAWQTSVGFCNQLVVGSLMNTWEGTKDNCFGIDDSGFLHVYSSKFSTLDEFNIVLTGNPMTFIYKLATPITEELTTEQVQAFKQLQTFNEVTHINADGDVIVRYYCNTDSGDTVGMLHEMVESNKSELEDFDIKLSGILKIVTKTIEIGTIQASLSAIGVTDKLLLDGYSPIAISGFSISNPLITLSRIELNVSDGKVYYTLNNPIENDISNVSLTVNVLFTKSDFFTYD